MKNPFAKTLMKLLVILFRYTRSFGISPVSAPLPGTYLQMDLFGSELGLCVQVDRYINLLTVV